MNKKYDRTDGERDQLRRLEQGEAEQQKARRDEMPGRRQQHADAGPRRQKDGWATQEEDPSGRASGSVRNGDSSEKLVDEP